MHGTVATAPVRNTLNRPQDPMNLTQATCEAVCENATKQGNMQGPTSVDHHVD